MNLGISPQTHATTLPYMLAFNAVRAPEAASKITASFGSNSALDCLRRLHAACFGTDPADLAR